ncbi:MAG: hypothetical protein MUF58_02530 [Arcicella sp.]|jgi:isopropylmalate/homocitrate/citramalate synthase|nr:hypothetical protein [Arcicella sp.]
MAEQAVKIKRVKQAKEVHSQDKQNPKTTQIQFRVSVKDKRQLEAKAKASGKKKLSIYLLELGLNASEAMVEKVVEKIEEDSELVITLRALRQSLVHVGNNLNQLLKKSNSIGFLSHFEQRQVSQLSHEIESLCQEIKTKI